MTQCACGSYHTEELTTYREYVYKGFVETIEILHTECQDCGSEFATRFQVNRNASQVSIAKFKIDKAIATEIADSVEEVVNSI